MRSAWKIQSPREVLTQLDRRTTRSVLTMILPFREDGAGPALPYYCCTHRGVNLHVVTDRTLNRLGPATIRNHRNMKPIEAHLSEI